MLVGKFRATFSKSEFKIPEEGRDSIPPALKMQLFTILPYVGQLE